MAIFRECKHSFQIVQALFGKSASTLVFSTAKVRISPESLRTLFASATLRLSESGTMPRISTAEREQGRCDSSKGNTFRWRKWDRLFQMADV